MRVGNKRFIDSYLFIPIHLANFTKTFGLEEMRKGFFPHYLTLPEALAEPASALHSPCDCKATNGCHLQYQFSQDCYHCTEERRKKKSALPGKARSATFSFLPGEFPPPCLFGINSMKTVRISRTSPCGTLFKEKTTKPLLLYSISDKNLLSTVGPTLRFCVRECPNSGA